MMRAPRAEITAIEKSALGRLMGRFTTADGPLVLAPADPERATFDALVGRGGWVTKSDEGGYTITNYGLSAFYTAKVVRR